MLAGVLLCRPHLNHFFGKPQTSIPLNVHAKKVGKQNQSILILYDGVVLFYYSLIYSIHDISDSKSNHDSN